LELNVRLNLVNVMIFTGPHLRIGLQVDVVVLLTLIMRGKGRKIGGVPVVTISFVSHNECIVNLRYFRVEAV